MFPVDFFEHCSVMNDIEFGGNDLLQVYNVQQLKNRLNSQGKFQNILFQNFTYLLHFFFFY